MYLWIINITKEQNENNEIEEITDKSGKLWLNERHVQEQLGQKNLPALTNKYPEEYKKMQIWIKWVNKTTK